MVGCVLVQDGSIVGEGWHRVLGGPHAEVEALQEAGDRARGATAYVSLEPCSHHGRTPPCTQALTNAGVRRVVYGARDPGVGGGGARILQEEGVQVIGPVLTAEAARRDDPAYFHAAEKAFPYVALKLAVSLDGGISAGPGLETSVTSTEARTEAHRLRAGFSALMVGGETARVDDPLLTVRGPVEPRTPPARVVLDGRGRLSPGARMVTEGEGPVIVFVGPEADPGNRSRLVGAGVRVEEVPHGPEGRGVDLERVLGRLWELDVRSILCEGGGRVASSFLQGGWVRDLHLFLAPCFLGPDAVPAFPDAPAPDRGWVPVGEPRRLGPDVLVTLERMEESCSPGS